MKQMFSLLTLSISLFYHSAAQAQLHGIGFSNDSLAVTKLVIDHQPVPLDDKLPVVTFLINKQPASSASGEKKGMRIQWLQADQRSEGFNGVLLFKNISTDTITLENVVPFGTDNGHIYITGSGNHELSRTHLFLPGKQPVNVIVPDNAWDLGYCSFPVNDDISVTALVRRDRGSIDKGSRTRFETVLYPGGSVKYKFYSEAVKGDWRQGLTYVFQTKMLYDVDKFDNSLFERKDLQWIRHAYVMHLMEAWDKFYYDETDNKYHLEEFLKRGQRLYGGDDIIGIWPTWPALGLDQRNQFDLFRDLPGGMKQTRAMAELLHRNSSRLFVCYNPWDENTRSEDHFSGVSDLISETQADGVVLDTKGESSKELQNAADRVRKGVIMYSEGMAVPKDMSGIPSGRVHNALYYPPMLNLNKLIKPEFAIFRVAELFKEPIRREFATSFFNGYGTEINIMAPGQPDWVEEQYHYLGRTSRILRENTYNFTDGNWKPLLNTTADSIWVNQWPKGAKTIYTVYSIRPQGFNDYLFEITPKEHTHFVDLWHHDQLQPEDIKGKWMIKAKTDVFNQSWLGTNNEGEVDCIAQLPSLIEVHRNGDELYVQTPVAGDEVRIWAGNPSYEKQPFVVKPGYNRIRLSDRFGRFEGKFVVQLMDKGILLDENMESIAPGQSRRISISRKTPIADGPIDGMVKIRAGKFTFKTTHGDEFIPYPKQDEDSTFELLSFYMDQYPVTNAQFKKFIDATHYRPSDTANYLRNWVQHKIRRGEENFPVVYISYEDAQAYAKWMGKRLPTEIEWQYAAQTPALNEWPWVQSTPVVRKTQFVTNTLSVSTIVGIDSNMCNLGDGRLHPVGEYKKGVNPNGLYDLVGSIWQLTNDVYMNGSFRYVIIKGGSYFKPSSSWWYVQGGPRELYYRQQLIRMSQGFERNATVGFRCVKDCK